MKKLGLYIHIPFCAKKCLYCDFLSFENNEFDEHRKYIEALKKEIKYYGEVYGNTYSVDSIFLGGGTPSLIDEHFVWELILSVKDHFKVSCDVEITIESNPKTLNRHKLEIYRQAGINRLSIGVQSLNDMALLSLGRIHKVEDFIENYKLAREVGFENINIDLMFAIPEHNESVWEDTLQKAVELTPEHISFYSLQLEEGTPYFDMFEKGEIKQIPDDLDRRLYHKAIKVLNDAGYAHYEISNCAKSGFECKHNLKYWNMDNYLGLGLGSHSFIDGTRFSNTREITLYYKQFMEVEIDKVCVQDRHENTLEESVAEYIFTGMRRLNGIDLIDFEARFGKELFAFYPDKKSLTDKYMEQGYVIIENNRMRFTLKGIDISNIILSEFV